MAAKVTEGIMATAVMMVMVMEVMEDMEDMEDTADTAAMEATIMAMVVWVGFCLY
jgi:hypothetical protein